MRRRREQSIEIQQMKYFEEQQQKVKIDAEWSKFTWALIIIVMKHLKLFVKMSQSQRE